MQMTYDDVMVELEAAGSEQTRKTYRRHGVPDPMFGVSFAKLGELTKRIKADQDLADRLWATPNSDARMLAAMVADPKRQTPETLDAWVAGMGHHSVALYLAKLAVRTPHARALAERWIASPEERTARAGWDVVALLAMEASASADPWFAALLPRIEAGIHQAANREKEAMNGALIAIGIRDDAAEAALAAARRIGPVAVDHGDTDCKTPLAEPYILKARARQAERAAKAAARAAAPKQAKAKA